MKKLITSVLLSVMFAAGAYAQCAASYTSSINGSVVAFTNTSATAPANQIFYYWNFDDGTGSSAINPIHTYSQAGYYVVCLTVIDSTTLVGCSSTYCDTIIIAGSGVSCQANLGYYPDTTAAANTVTFYNSSAPSGYFTSYFWDYGDGNTGTSSVSSSNHTYAQSGYYYACLTITLTDSSGSVVCTSTDCDTIQASSSVVVNCLSSFQHHADTLNIGNTVFYSTTPLNPSYTMTYAWDFGDGNSASGISVAHVYAQSGVYVACLSVSLVNGNGNVVCITTSCDTINVMINTPNPLQCNASFYGDSSSTASTINVYNNSTPVSSAALSVSYSWNFGDGSTSNQAYPTHTYASSGLYNLCLTVEVIDNNTGDSCVSTYCHQIGVDSSGAVYFKTNGPGFTLNVLDPATIGLTEAVLSNVSLYPNPAQNEVTIDLGTQLEGKANWSLYDLKGMNLSNGAVSDIQTKVDISKLNTGVYILRVESGSAISNHKLQIVK